MADASPPESVAGPPTGGNGQYIGVVVVLLLALGALGAWKTLGKKDEKSKKAAAPTASAPPKAKPTLTIAPPAPPEDDEEEDKKEEEEKPKKKAVKGGGGGCAGKCKGKQAGGFAREIGGIGRMARSCYERALSRNSSLKGRVVVSGRVSSSGRFCSVRVSNGLGDAGVSSCIRSVFVGRQVSAKPSGGCVDFNLPLNFQPRGK